MKKQNKEHKNAIFIDENLKTKSDVHCFYFFLLFARFSNFDT